MSGATFKFHNQAPRDTPMPLNEFAAGSPQGPHFENVAENHQPIAESFTSSENSDELLSDAIRIVTEQGKASTSFLQRKLMIGYSRAARLMDILENIGIIGPQVGVEPRTVISSTPVSQSHQEPQAHGGSLTRNEAPVVVSIESSPAEIPAISQVVGPGEYHPGYAEQMVRYFDKPKVKKIYDTYTWKSGAVSEKERFVPATPPHFSEFARSIGVTTRTLKRWAAQHEEFREAYITCEEIYEEFLIENGLTGAYGAIAMKFVAVNKTKMKDKVVTENQHVDINKVLDQIAAGNLKPGGQLELQGSDY